MKKITVYVKPNEYKILKLAKEEQETSMSTFMRESALIKAYELVGSKIEAEEAQKDNNLTLCFWTPDSNNDNT